MMGPMAVKTITKLEAARRQLDCAIRLYLAQDDLAAVQTLAWAALSVLRDLARARGSGIPTHSMSGATISIGRQRTF
jgi:hypothetical protein